MLTANLLMPTPVLLKLFSFQIETSRHEQNFHKIERNIQQRPEL